MKKWLGSALLFIMFGFLVLSQAIQITSHINVEQVDEATISSASYISDINAAHITAPATLPVQNEYKADPILPAVKTVVYQITSIANQVDFFQNDVEAAGFLDVRKYQSNYLPLYE
ncbi:hypothetical protein GCM10011409_05450 [Lentibacillus populi]|uniref:Uncharacterized protein n=1 Tax=Lentibacillus populi TaxID=1827502 RepID=A0A9W5TUZ5_9BACI|nr:MULTISPECIES: hypothetical protein [Bacillaceae]MBT2215019.1 hypothetical protein [Virgibacillus dakarensis]GGB30997.1 hypothetical protein GCM10011409_05450 [Lentibacillus populi]